MRKGMKILIGIALLFLVLGVAYAANTNEIFKAPNGLEPMGIGSFVDRQGHNIDILEYTDDNYNTWFKNDTDPLYLVQPSENNPNIYIGATDDDSYIHEVVEKDGNKYIVTAWTPKSTSTDAEIIWEKLQEFNTLNNVKPMEV